MKTAAIYARVSSDKQRGGNTIASQTAALVAFAREQQFEVPREWVFEDDGYSGASLSVPGLSGCAILLPRADPGRLIYAPDRLSRRYAHQMLLLIEEFARAGVETLFVRAPRGSTPEDELLVQFQGMIAEYERAQILERSRRGNDIALARARSSVLSGAPFDIVLSARQITRPRTTNQRRAGSRCTVDVRTIQRSGLSIGAIARLLNEQASPPASDAVGGAFGRSGACYAIRRTKATACFGKTTIAPRQRITRPIRMTWWHCHSQPRRHERPRGDWITIAVPPIVSRGDLCARAGTARDQQAHAPRRTVTPSVVQGLVSCSKCGYALYGHPPDQAPARSTIYRCSAPTPIAPWQVYW